MVWGSETLAMEEIVYYTYDMILSTATCLFFFFFFFLIYHNSIAAMTTKVLLWSSSTDPKICKYIIYIY